MVVNILRKRYRPHRVVVPPVRHPVRTTLLLEVEPGLKTNIADRINGEDRIGVTPPPHALTVHGIHAARTTRATGLLLQGKTYLSMQIGQVKSTR